MSRKRRSRYQKWLHKQQLWTSPRGKLSPVLFAGLFVVVGAVVILRALADVPTNNVATATGSITGNATTVPASLDVGGNAVKFGAATTAAAATGTNSGGSTATTSTGGSGGSGGGTHTPTPAPPPAGTPAPTANSCPSPKPTAPVSGYTIVKCEDFNSGLGAFGPYSGGGGSTTVGAGRTPGQCVVSGGYLALKQASNGATCGGWMNGFDQRYGYWEVRMKAAYTGSGSGSAPHPVLILWPGNNAWTSELDWFETNLGSPAGGYLHCTNSGGNASGNCYILPANSIDYSQWHVYGFQWSASSMTGYIDGTKWWSSSNTSSFQPLADSNLTIQLDNLSGSTPVRPGEMDIDWAHMYK